MKRHSTFVSVCAGGTSVGKELTHATGKYVEQLARANGIDRNTITVGPAVYMVQGPSSNVTAMTIVTYLAESPVPQADH